MSQRATLLSIQEASQWASQHTGKNITPSNISYLIQYGRIQKITHNGQTQVAQQDIVEYYKAINKNKFQQYKTEPAVMPFHTRLLGKDRMAYNLFF